MNPMMNAQLQQQWAGAMMAAQQGVAAEAMRNPQGAAQCYHQAALTMQQSIGMAQQWGVFVPDTSHATLACAHMSAARAKAAIGFTADAWQHLGLALGSINQAIAQNAGVPAYHAVAGTIMMTLGNTAEAERAFGAVQQMCPGEPQSLQMLQSLRAMRAAGPAPMPAYGAAPAAQPFGPAGASAPQGGMPMWGAAPPHAGMPGAARPGAPHATDWVKTIKNVCDVANSIMGTVSKFQKLEQQF